MKLPRILGPIEDKGEDKRAGIINEIAKKYHGNIAFSSLVVPQVSAVYHGNVTAVVNWENEVQSGPSNPWIQISFPNSKLNPTGYTLKGPVSLSKCFASKWKVEAFNDDESDPSLWDTVAINQNTESNYCNTNANVCSDPSVGHFIIPATNKRYKHFRWSTVTSRCTFNSVFFVTGGIDLFGTLYTENGECNPNNQIKIFKHALFYILIVNKSIS